ncbi:Carbohydrate diacid regulator [bioreactor metagenome]|uniref:Carbohydrate diacid regulator n=1 Tax=bioreactor metagenome TaxID=1076179 RepID=A0A644V9P6_9ZZZZ|nr:helix-turn-helix domain-containing protein [Desulfitobacterium hafniense]MEA5025810.1 helix-turn-helix domain-containing protein [Desulfitobacterium hafniense]
MKKYVDWVKRIAKAQADNCGVVGLSRLLMEKIEKVVFVSDKRGRVLCWQAPQSNPTPQEEKILLTGSVLKATEESKGIITLSGQKHDFSCWPIIHQEILGYLWVLTGGESLSSDEIDSIECIRSAILVEIVKSQEHGVLKEHLRDELIYNMLFNNYDSTNFVEHVWGWNLSSNHLVMVVEETGKMEGRGLPEVRTQIEELLIQKYPDVATGMVGPSFVALFPINSQPGKKNRQDDGRWKSIAAEAFVQLQEEMVNIELWAGVGNIYWDQKTLYRSYQEAKVALQMGRFSGKESKLAFFDELGAMRLFYNQREQDLRDYFNEVIGPVQKYDQENNTNLLSTLWTYYIVGGNIAATTAKMHIHFNTLRYRLQKIEGLLGAKLDDQEVRFNVYAALKVGIMIGIFKTDG